MSREGEADDEADGEREDVVVDSEQGLPGADGASAATVTCVICVTVPYPR